MKMDEKGYALDKQVMGNVGTVQIDPLQRLVTQEI
jgi:hypothetical protein